MDRLIPVFDVGQVLVRWDPAASFARHAGTRAAAEALMAEIGFVDWHTRQDAGRPVAEGVADHAARFPHHRAAIASFYDDWLESIPGEVPGSAAIFDRLLRDGPVYGISNFSRELFDRTIPAYPVLGRFTDVVLSGDVKINKPDPRIYQALCARNGLDPDACVFIDDSLANVKAAEDFGMIGVAFTDAKALADRLTRLGFDLA